MSSRPVQRSKIVKQIATRSPFVKLDPAGPDHNLLSIAIGGMTSSALALRQLHTRIIGSNVNLGKERKYVIFR